MTKEATKNPRRNRAKSMPEAAPAPKTEKRYPAVLHSTASFGEEPDRSQIIWIVD